jgi:hypothetical protein
VFLTCPHLQLTNLPIPPLYLLNYLSPQSLDPSKKERMSNSFKSNTVQPTAGGGGGGPEMKSSPSGTRDQTHKYAQTNSDLLFSRIRNGTFGVMHILNNDKQSSFYHVVLEAIIDTMQLCYFSFSPDIFPWHTKVGDLMAVLTSIFNVSAIVSS